MSAAAAPRGALSPDLKEAERFLRALDPESDEFTFQTWTECKTSKGRDPLGFIRHGTLRKHAAELISLQRQGAAVAVVINETNFKGRAASNVVRVRALYADFDGVPLENVERLQHKPHIVIESSPGRWHVYYRTQGVTLDLFEGFQKHLIKTFDSDPAITDLSRVMRLPGFLHLKKAGEPFMTRIVEMAEPDARLYGRDDFPRDDQGDLSDAFGGPVDSEEAKTPSRATVGSVERQAEALPPNVAALPGREERETALRWADDQAQRSRREPTKGRHGIALDLGHRLKEAGVSRNVAVTIAARRFAEKVRPTDSDGAATPYAEARAVAAIGNAYAGNKKTTPRKPQARGPVDPEAADADVERLNSEYAYVVAGGRAAVLKERGSEAPDFWKLDAFKNLYANRFVEMGRTRVSLSDYWLKHPQRRSYDRIVFKPQQTVPGAYNMWRGFAFEPAAGDCSLFLAHIHDNVASGNKEIARWVIGWFAQIFQQPTKKTGTALALKGGQGSGKTFVGQQFGRLLGHHYGLYDDPEHVTGKFTAQLENKILIHADEAIFAADPRIVSRLRSMVTSNTTIMERKGIDAVQVDNYMRLFISSDKDWVIPAAMEERRFAVLQMGEDKMQNGAYFKAIQDQMDAGGYQALLKYLLEFDLDSVNLREIPKTAALMEQKVNTLSGVARFWMNRLDAGELIPDSGQWPEEFPKTKMHELYQAEAQKAGDRWRMSPIQFGTQLKALCPMGACKMLVETPFTAGDGSQMMDVKRVNGYRLPSLSECRALFERKVKQGVDWSDPDEGECF